MFLLLTLNKPIFAESHQINGNFSTFKEQIQPGILSNSLFFLEHELLQGDIIVTNYDTSFVSGMYILKHVCYLRTSVTAIHFLHCHSFTVGSTWSDPIYQGYCVYFTALITAINYKNWSVVYSRKFEGYLLCLFEESHSIPGYSKVPVIAKNICSNFCLKGSILNYRDMILNFSIILFIQFSIISPWLNARKHLQRSHPILSWKTY